MTAGHRLMLTLVRTVRSVEEAVLMPGNVSEWGGPCPGWGHWTCETFDLSSAITRNCAVGWRGSGPAQQAMLSLGSVLRNPPNQKFELNYLKKVIRRFWSVILCRWWRHVVLLLLKTLPNHWNGATEWLDRGPLTKLRLTKVLISEIPSIEVFLPYSFVISKGGHSVHPSRSRLGLPEKFREGVSSCDGAVCSNVAPAGKERPDSEATVPSVTPTLTNIFDRLALASARPIQCVSVHVRGGGGCNPLPFRQWFNYSFTEKRACCPQRGEAIGV